MLRTKLLIGVLVGVLFATVAMAEPVKVVFWHAMGKHLGETIDVLVQKFNQENEGVIEVEAVYQGGYGSLEQKLFGAVASGEPPTIVQQYEDVTVQMLDALVPLEDYISPELVQDIFPNIVEMNIFNGKMYTVPFNKSIIVLYYRPDLVPEPPTTWEEYLAKSCELTVDEDGDGTPERYGTGLRYTPELFFTFLAQNEGAVISEEGEILINNQAGLETAQYLAELAKCALVQSAYFSQGALPNGLVAMFLSTSAGYRYNISAAETGGYELKVATVPCHKTCASMIQGTNLAVFSMNQTEDQIAAAAKFVEFLLRPDNMVYWAKETGYMPITYSAINSEEWQTYVEDNPDRAAMVAQFQHGISAPHHPAWADIRSLFYTYNEMLYTGELSPEDYVNELAAEIRAILEQ